MYDRELYNKICNITCTIDELKAFCAMDKREYDLDNPLKYFKAETAIDTIEKYQRGEINGDYLAYWSNAYMHIITGDYKSYFKNGVSLKALCMEEICDYLDGLSFFTDDVSKYYDLEDYKRHFTLFDKLIDELDNCKAEFTFIDCAQERAVLLVTNSVERYFIRLDTMIYYSDFTSEFKKVDMQNLQCALKQLRYEGYVDLAPQFIAYGLN